MDNYSYIKSPCIDVEIHENVLDVPCKQTIDEDFTIFHLNIRSIRKNWDSFLVIFEKLCIKKEVAGVILTEVNITTDETFLYKINGFNVYSSLREGRRGGGILLYIKQDFKFTNENFKMTNSESIIGILNIKGKTIRILAIYRLPDQNVLYFLQELEHIVKMSKNKKTIIIGDININL